MGPINYLAAAPQADFLRNIQGGLQIGQAWQQGQREAQLFEQQQAQLQAQQQAAQQYQADVSAAMANPTPAGIRALALKYPQHGKVYSELLTGLSGEQRTAALGDTASLAAALSGGRTDVASRLVDQRIEAMRTRGEQTADVEALRDAIKTNPQAAYGHALSLLAGFGEDGSKVLDTLSKARTQPLTERKAAADTSAAESDAATKAIAAKYGEQSALLDLQKKGWDIRGIEADIEFKKQSTRIAAMNAALGREGNDLKRQELQLKIQEARGKLDEKVRDRVAAAESGASAIDNMLNTVERIKTNKSLDSVVGSLEGKAFYPNTVAGTLNPFGNGDERADAIALIETLGSQAFLAQIPNIKGMGALSNAEGDKLQSALQNLSRAQSEGQFRANLDEAARLLKKGRESLSRSTGVPLGKPDTPAAPGTRPPLSTFEQ